MGNKLCQLNDIRPSVDYEGSGIRDLAGHAATITAIPARPHRSKLQLTYQGSAKLPTKIMILGLILIMINHTYSQKAICISQNFKFPLIYVLTLQADYVNNQESFTLILSKGNVTIPNYHVYMAYDLMQRYECDLALQIDTNIEITIISNDLYYEGNYASLFPTITTLVKLENIFNLSTGVPQVYPWILNGTKDILTKTYNYSCSTNSVNSDASCRSIEEFMETTMLDYTQEEESSTSTTLTASELGTSIYLILAALLTLVYNDARCKSGETTPKCLENIKED